ncbi:hypothetical protein Tco_0836822 [Tanacetum coccineum]
MQTSNVGRPLIFDEPTDEMMRRKYSILDILGHSKTWILESYRVTAIRYFDRYNRYPRVAAWNKKKGKVFGGPMWASSFQGHVNSSYFNMGTPPNFQTPMPSQPGSSVGKTDPSHMGRQNLQTTIETIDVEGIFSEYSKRRRREQFS